MMKVKKTADELVELVRQELNLAGVSLLVMEDKIYGWNAFAMPVPADEPDIHYKLQVAVENLRKRFDLGDPAPSASAGHQMTHRDAATNAAMRLGTLPLSPTLPSVNVNQGEPTMANENPNPNQGGQQNQQPGKEGQQGGQNQKPGQQNQQPGQGGQNNQGGQNQGGQQNNQR